MPDTPKPFDASRRRKSFWLARRSDGHRFDGSRISAFDVADAEAEYRRLRFNLSSDLMVVGAKPALTSRLESALLSQGDRG